MHPRHPRRRSLRKSTSALCPPRYCYYFIFYALFRPFKAAIVVCFHSQLSIFHLAVLCKWFHCISLSRRAGVSRARRDGSSAVCPNETLTLQTDGLLPFCQMLTNIQICCRRWNLMRLFGHLNVIAVSFFAEGRRGMVMSYFFQFQAFFISFSYYTEKF